MRDKPSKALRRGRKTTSMWRTIEALWKLHDADVAVSAGNTGALMAMAKFQLRQMAGIARPAIAAIWPTKRSANRSCSMWGPMSAQMSSTSGRLCGDGRRLCPRAVFGLERPTLGLLNIGIEEMKGNDAVKELGGDADFVRAADGPQLPIQFEGFIEGDDISTGTVDVVVTDGFTGNIALKNVAEGTARLISHYLRELLTLILALETRRLVCQRRIPRVAAHEDGPRAFGSTAACSLGTERCGREKPRRHGRRTWLCQRHRPSLSIWRATTSPEPHRERSKPSLSRDWLRCHLRR